MYTLIISIHNYFASELSVWTFTTETAFQFSIQRYIQVGILMQRQSKTDQELIAICKIMGNTQRGLASFSTVYFMNNNNNSNSLLLTLVLVLRERYKVQYSAIFVWCCEWCRVKFYLCVSIFSKTKLSFVFQRTTLAIQETNPSNSRVYEYINNALWIESLLTKTKILGNTGVQTLTQ